MTFDQETHPRIEFSNNPLKVVVAQIRFPALYGLIEPAALAVFQTALRQYPSALSRISNITVTIGEGGGANATTDAGPVRFASEDGAWIINITTDWVSLETTKYESWIGFRTRFEELLGAFPGDLRPTRITRIGVRYVDQIQAPGVGTPADWRRYIVPSLLGAEDSLIFDERIAQGLQQLTFRIGEDAINVRHGYVRNDITADFPSTYVIDSDLFTDAEQPFEVPAILERSNRYHDWAWSLFRRSITPAAVELLGGIEP